MHLQALEACVERCPVHSAPYCSNILVTAQRFLKFDPNMASGDGCLAEIFVLLVLTYYVIVTAFFNLLYALQQ